MDYKFSVLRTGEVSLDLEGDLDRRTVPRRRGKLLSVARKKTAKRLTLNFSRVSTIDTAGVALLVEIKRAIADRRGELRLAHLNERARRVIRLARLDQFFGLEDDANGSSDPKEHATGRRVEDPIASNG